MQTRIFSQFADVFAFDESPGESWPEAPAPSFLLPQPAASTPADLIGDTTHDMSGGEGAAITGPEEEPESEPHDPDPTAPNPPEPSPPPPPPPSDPSHINYSRVLEDRPDVLKEYYEAYYGRNDPTSTAWTKRVGGESPEGYALYWYAKHGKYEGYSQGPTTAQDNVSLEQILKDRPDVLKQFYVDFYTHNDKHSDAFMKRVGGDTPEAYARYWYEKYGKWEGYAQSEKQAAENIDVERLLAERPDVFRAFHTEFYGEHNDRKSSAWVDRVGGDTVQDYAKYWYETYGRWQGYNQRPASSPSDGGGDSPGEPYEPDPNQPEVVDPSLDPENHPAIYPDGVAAMVGRSLEVGDMMG